MVDDMSKSVDEKISFSLSELDIEIGEEVDLNLSLEENINRSIDHGLNSKISSKIRSVRDLEYY